MLTSQNRRIFKIFLQRETGLTIILNISKVYEIRKTMHEQK